LSQSVISCNTEPRSPNGTDGSISERHWKKIRAPRLCSDAARSADVIGFHGGCLRIWIDYDDKKRSRSISLTAPSFVIARRRGCRAEVGRRRCANIHRLAKAYASAPYARVLSRAESVCDQRGRLRHNPLKVRISAAGFRSCRRYSEVRILRRTHRRSNRFMQRSSTLLPHQSRVESATRSVRSWNRR